MSTLLPNVLCSQEPTMPLVLDYDYNTVILPDNNNAIYFNNMRNSGYFNKRCPGHTKILPKNHIHMRKYGNTYKL